MGNGHGSGAVINEDKNFFGDLGIFDLILGVHLLMAGEQ